MHVLYSFALHYCALFDRKYCPIVHKSAESFGFTFLLSSNNLYLLQLGITFILCTASFSIL